ncbi:hypothetical protein GGTG_09570 [Gaeumannomyces tritici R3-111a-1]|uniref:WHIM1 domain-containing protein n=1 Tax=Gaeumannomyces tritici (strain R3-111a-1) TaxID=644352 RepID=J3P7S8_GAET3|nr:hypothetical protein GGTG_09570 [Gaeumannomyces tritici R3-111a-1]EJT72711.1 hypothetical protein GGTG_09570 [Gaeumannomyces tritici R3-111a-1]
MADDDSSDLSSVDSLSPPPPEDDCEVQLKKQDGILKFFHKVPKKQAVAAAKSASPPPPKRAPSPAHEYVLADNPDIAFIVMFRNKFNDVFSKTLTTFGPQELEREIVDSVPGDRVEAFLCAILKLLLNRQQEVKPGHYNRALEDAIKTHEASWPGSWGGANPLAGGTTFNSMTPTQRLDILRTLILWTMQSSKTVKDIIDNAYKNKRQEDDLNQPLSVQPLGSDSDKRRYFLVEGPEYTSFRIYRESNPAGFQRTWWSVAGSIEEVHALTGKLLTADGAPKARKLGQKLQEQIPHFEESLEKLRRREYRLQRKQQFKRPDPGFSLYEGRTRGKRAKYTYDDEEDYEFNSDSTATRRSTRNTGTHTPAEPAGPVTTASGRQVRAPSRLNVETRSNNGGGTSASNSVREDSEMRDDEPKSATGRGGRPLRSAAVNHGMNGWAPVSKKKKGGDADSYDSDAEDEESEPDFGGDEEDEHVPDESEEEVDEEFEADDANMVDDDDQGPDTSLVVKLPVKVVLDGKTGKYSRATRSSGAALASPSSSSERSAGRAEPGTPDGTAFRATLGSPVHTEEEISVSIKPVTPETESETKTTHNALPTTSLAFRGSPEKSQHTRRSVDI